MYRQGDVLIIPVESIPEKLDAIEREDSRLMAASTGDPARISSRAGVELEGDKPAGAAPLVLLFARSEMCLPGHTIFAKRREDSDVVAIGAICHRSALFST